ncbi:MAG: LUD domain-containing protein [Candidatus Thorarchaeota archaeon]
MDVNNTFFELIDRVNNALDDASEISARKYALDLITNQKNYSLEKIPKDELKQKIKHIKKEWLKKLPELVDIAKKGLSSVGCEVYYAKTPRDALQYLEKIVGSNKLVVKSKTNAGSEIGLVKHLTSSGNEVIETDLGDRIVQMRNERGTHPIVPAVHVSREKIAEIFGLLSTATVDDIIAKARGEIRKYIVEAEFGISGCNVLAAEEGAIFLCENEGNIRFISNAPPIHIVICPVNKIVPDIDLAFTQIRLLSVYATGQITPVYLSMISGPSKTGDIEFDVRKGMHGPKEVHVILLDNCRINASKSPLKESLLCIGCGSCINECPVYEQLGIAFGGPTYVGPIGIVYTAVLNGIQTAVESGLNFCTMCKRCGDVCPVDIPIPDLIKYIRDRAASKEMLVPPLADIEKRIEKTGNPFGKEV